MSTYAKTTPQEIKRLTADICCRKITDTRRVIGKSIQTIRQYLADVETTASRLMPAEDMVKLAIYHNQRAFTFTAESLAKVEHSISTGELPPLPRWIDASKTRIPDIEIFIAYDPNGTAICKHRWANFAQQAADVVNGYVNKFVPINQEADVELTENQQLRSRFRRMYFDGSMEIDIACELMNCDLYAMLNYFREFPYETDAPDPDLLEAILVQSALKQIVQGEAA